MSDKQYAILLALYHEYNEAFVSLPQPIKDAFYTRLWDRVVPKPVAQAL